MPSRVFLLLLFCALVQPSYAQPDTVANLVLWLEADSGITLSGNQVSQWQDQSVNGYIANVSSSQPYFVDTIPLINSKPFVYFDGTSELTFPSISMGGANEVSVFALVRVRVKVSFGMYACYGINTAGSLNLRQVGGSGRASFISGSDNTGAGEIGGAPAGNTTDMEGIGFVLISGFFDGATNEWRLYENDSLVHTNTNAFTLSAIENFHLGHRGGSLKLDGDIAELLLYNRNLNDSNKTLIQTYFYDKYAPPVNLGPDVLACDTTYKLPAGAYYDSYLWSTGDTTDSIDITTAGVYWLQATDIFGRVSSDTISLSGFITPFSINPPDSVFACVVDTPIVWNTGLDMGTYSFLWQDSSTDSVLSITQTGNYYVTATHSNGCTKSSDTTAILVDTYSTIASLGPDTTFCFGNAIELQQGDSLTASYLWIDTTTDSTLTIDTTGYYWVTVTDSFGCFVTDSIYVEIKGIAPNVNFGSSITCFGDSVQFNDSTLSLDSSLVIVWLWRFGDGDTSILPNPTHLYGDTGSFNVMLTVSTDSGCGGSITKPVQIYPTPIPSFSNTLPTVGNNTQFSDLSDGLGYSITQWQWDFGDPASGGSNYSTMQNPTHNYSSSGYYQIKLYIETAQGCGDSIVQSILVFGSIPSDLMGLQLWLASDNGVNLTGNQVNQWQDISGQGNDAIQGAGSNQPVFVDSLTVLNNHGVLSFDGTDDFLEITDNASIDFTDQMSIFIISRQSALLTNKVLLAKWDFATQGSWALQTHPDSSDEMLLYVADTIIDGGTNRLSTMNANCQGGAFNMMNIGYNGNNTVESNRISVYKNGALINTSISGSISSSLQNSTASLKIGKFGGGLTRFFNGDIAEIIIYDTVLSTNQRKQIEEYFRFKYAPPVNLGPDRQFSYGECSIDLVAGSRFVNYVWSTGAATDTISITQPGEYAVTVTDIFGYTSSDTLTITAPGNLSDYRDTTLCMNTSFVWSTGLDTSIYSVVWQDTSVGPSHAIVQEDVYYFTITDDSSCVFYSDTISVLIDSFEVTMMMDPEDTVCAGFPVVLVQGAASADTYLWCNGATTSSRVADSTGTYCVTVTDTNGCTAQDSGFKKVIGTAPVAAFTYTPTCLGDLTTFTDISDTSLSGAIVAWIWDFGDGNGGFNPNPVHLYDSAGSVNVNLSVVTIDGCGASISQTIDVRGLPAANFSPVLGCSNAATAMQDQSSITADTIVSWLWMFDSLGTDSVASPIFVYPDTGDYAVTLVAMSNFGCIDSITQTVRIKEAPNVGFDYLLSCGTNTVTFSDTSIINSPGSPWYTWTFGDGSSPSTTTPTTHTYSSTGVYNVTLTVQLINGCSATFVDSIAVAPIVVNADFTGDYICVNEPHTFVDISTAVGDTVILWYWQMDTLGSSSSQNPSFTYPDSGAHTVTLHATSAKGCIDSISKTVTVHGRPTVDFSFSPQFGVNPTEPVQFTNESKGCASYRWDFGDGEDTITSANPSHQYADTGVYQVTLHCLSGYNCPDSLTKLVDVRAASVDVEVVGVSADCQPGLVENITISLVNRGTREITSIDLFVRIEGSDPIREQWTGFLEPQEVETYTFAVAFPLDGSQAINYICAWTENPNGVEDEVPTNNEQCVACENNFALIDLFPNPATDQLNVWFVLPQSDDIKADIHDERGAYIGEAFSGMGVKGLNQVTINTSDLRVGIYALRIEYLGTSYVRTFVVH